MAESALGLGENMKICTNIHEDSGDRLYGKASIILDSKGPRGRESTLLMSWHSRLWAWADPKVLPGGVDNQRGGG